MIEQKYYRKMLNKRTLIFTSIKVLLFSTVLARLYKLQVIDSKKYKTLADENRINVLIHMPERGLIYDVDGFIIAQNRVNYSLTITPSLIEDLNSVITDLSAFVHLDKEEVTLMKNAFLSDKASMPHIVKSFMNWDEVAKVYTNLLNLSGVEITASTLREYPSASKYFHIAGYTSIANKEEVKRDNFYSYPGIQVGKTGIESICEKFLRGFPGTEEVEVNSKGKIIRQLDLKKSIKGSDVYLTINSKLQKFVISRMGSMIGSAVVMDVNNGNILSSVSTPTIDGNKFTSHISKEEWKKISVLKNAPLLDKSVKGLYPPGSIFKLVVALAALKYDIVNTKEKIFCNGKFSLGNEDFHCWRKNGHSNVNFLKAISESCDNYFYDISLRLGIEKIHKEAQILGIGKKYEHFLKQSEGFVPNENWKKQTYSEPWQKGETLNVGIGQGFVLLTPVEMAVFTSIIVNGGNIVRPNIIKLISNKEEKIEINSKENKKLRKLYKNEHLEIIKKAMFRAVNSKSGTAWKSRVEDKSYIIGGKTGTSQVRKITIEEREKGIIKNEDLPWEKRDHSLFVGFAPYEKPKYVTAVVIEHGGSGSKVAAPIARDILVASRELLEGKKTILKYEKEDESI